MQTFVAPTDTQLLINKCGVQAASSSIRCLDWYKAQNLEQSKLHCYFTIVLWGQISIDLQGDG